MAAPQIGVQCLWTFQNAAIMPYLQQIGYPSWASPIILSFGGPVIGFVASPIIGAWSDKSTSKYGRRRPIIVGGLLSTMLAGFLFAACPMFLNGPTLLLGSALMFVVLDTTINVMQTPVRALLADVAIEEQATASQVIVTLFQGLGALGSFGLQKLWENPADHMLEMFSLMIGVKFYVSYLCSRSPKRSLS